MSNNAAMNRLILAGARRGERSEGAFARLADSSSMNSGPSSRRERLDALMAEREQAMHSGDEDALGFVEHKIDGLFDESRAASAESERPTSFDGGVMGRRGPPAPGGMVAETSGQLLMRSLQTFGAERRDGGARRQIGNLSND